MNGAAEHGIPPFVVVDEHKRPCRGFLFFEEAAEWARTQEIYLGQFQVLSRDDPSIKFSWLDRRGYQRRGTP